MTNVATAHLYHLLPSEAMEKVSRQAFSLYNYDQIVEFLTKISPVSDQVKQNIFDEISKYEDILINNGYGFTQSFRPQVKNGVMEHITVHNWYTFVDTKAIGGSDMTSYKDTILEAMNYHIVRVLTTLTKDFLLGLKKSTGDLVNKIALDVQADATEETLDINVSVQPGLVVVKSSKNKPFVLVKTKGKGWVSGSSAEISHD